MPEHEGQHDGCVLCLLYRINGEHGVRFESGPPPPRSWFVPTYGSRLTHEGHDVVQGEVISIREGW